MFTNWKLIDWLGRGEERMLSVRIGGEIEFSAACEILQNEIDITVMLCRSSKGGKVIDLQHSEGCLASLEMKLLKHMTGKRRRNSV